MNNYSRCELLRRQFMSWKVHSENLESFHFWSFKKVLPSNDDTNLKRIWKDIEPRPWELHLSLNYVEISFSPLLCFLLFCFWLHSRLSYRSVRREENLLLSSWSFLAERKWDEKWKDRELRIVQSPETQEFKIILGITYFCLQ